MILYVDSEGRIKDVETTTDSSLIQLNVDDEDNPFIGWAKEKICCYKVYTTIVPIYPDPEPEPEEGEEPIEPEPIGYKTVISGYTPYIDSRLLDTIEHIGKSVEAVTPYTETKTAYIGDTEATFSNRPGNLTVYFPHPYTVERLTDRIIISFEELEEVTDITISIL